MLTISVLAVTTLILHVTSDSSKEVIKTLVVPVPLEFPYRNERAEQCWLRIEEEDLIETLTIYCTIAHNFLRSHIYLYNSKKMAQDDVEVSLWNDETKAALRLDDESSETSSIKDWRATTVLDPITHLRIYVPLNAKCKLIMYNREGTSNYNANCGRLLYYVNDQMYSNAVSHGHFSKMMSCSFLLLLTLINNY